MFFLRNRLKEALISSAGFILGLILSSVAIHYMPVSIKDLDKAREIGIVSLTILSGYSKSQETLYFITAFFITVSTTLLVWLILGRRKALSSSSPSENLTDTSHRYVIPDGIKGKRLIIHLLVLFFIFILAYDTNFFYTTWVNHYTFFSEEGQHLSYVNDMLHGKMLYRDIYAIYGPLMEYPLMFLMKAFGPSLVLLRVYTFILALTGYFFIYILSLYMFRTKTAVLINLLIFISFYFPVFPAPNGSLLRVVIGLFGFYPFALYVGKKNSKYLFLSGIMVTISFLFSQEIGTSLLIAMVLPLIVDSFSLQRGSLKSLSKNVMMILSGALTIAAPVFIYFAINGAFMDYLDATLSYPIYVSLGFGGIPFPNLLKAFTSSLQNPSYGNLSRLYRVCVTYWPIVLYFAFASYLLLRIISKRLSSQDLLPIGILAFGLIIFKGALGRSGLDRNYLLLPPALLLSVLYIEKFLLALKRLVTKGFRERKGLILLYSTFSLILAFGIISYASLPALWCVKVFIQSNISKLYPSKGFDPSKMELLNIQRASNVRLPSLQAKRVKGVIEYFNKNASKDDSIFVFANDATYYFLLDKVMPSRFGVLHDAATPELKETVVKDLNRAKPKYVIDSRDLWQIDKIPEEVEFPQIVGFIEENYRLKREIYGVKILERKSEKIKKQNYKLKIQR